MPTKHLKYGGSTAARTIGCPAWQALAANLPAKQPKASPAAEEGTCLHDAMEYLIGEVISPSPEIICANEIIGECFNGIEITEDMLDSKLTPAADTLAYVFNRYKITPENIFLEPFVELIPDSAGGSIDVLAFSDDGKTAIIADYKFGFNPVEAENNAQLLFYALCADVDPQFTDRMTDIERLVLAIIQPSHDGEVDTTLKIWETDPDTTLNTFDAKITNAIAVAEEGKSEPSAGPHCKFCPAEAICPVKTGLARQAQRLPAIEVQNLAEYIPMAEELEAWIKAVRKMAHEQLEIGVKIDGYKLVNKRASRVWTDAEAVETKIKNMRGVKGHDQYEMKLKSPAQMEKLFKQKGVDFAKIADYITSVSSGTTMAKATDKRPEAPSVEAYRAAMAQLPE